jgi:hypothetical protein
MLIQGDVTGREQRSSSSTLCWCSLCIVAVSIKPCVSSQAPAAATAAATTKETPQERLKRLMQAQLNKAAQKDSLAVTQRKMQVCTGSRSRQQQLLKSWFWFAWRCLGGLSLGPWGCLWVVTSTTAIKAAQSSCMLCLGGAGLC